MAEYEPNDSRNVTGTATTPDGRWTNKDRKTPKGVPNPPKDEGRDPVQVNEQEAEMPAGSSADAAGNNSNAG